FVYLFFFSSRRRHTRFSRDWSSDVCSSDLSRHRQSQPPPLTIPDPDYHWQPEYSPTSICRIPGERQRPPSIRRQQIPANCWPDRSEERRVGKEWRSRRTSQQYRKNVNTCQI